MRYIYASEHSEKDKPQNRLLEEYIEKIVTTYQYCTEERHYSRRVSMEEIEKNDFNLNISCYIRTAVAESEIDLQAVNTKMVALEDEIIKAQKAHNEFLKELGLPLLP